MQFIELSKYRGILTLTECAIYGESILRGELAFAKCKVCVDWKYIPCACVIERRDQRGCNICRGAGEIACEACDAGRAIRWRETALYVKRQPEDVLAIMPDGRRMNV